MSVVQAIACDRCVATAAAQPQVEMRKLGWARVQTGTDVAPSTADLCPSCAALYRGMLTRWVMEGRQIALPLDADVGGPNV